MAKRDSVFSDEWRRCLKEHYQYVVSNQDKKTEETLTPIMHNAGFRDHELRQFYLEATMHIDNVSDDFVPDMERVAPESVEANEQTFNEQSFQVHPAECSCPACMDTVLEEGHDDEGQPLEEIDDEPPDDLPKQKSLF